MAKRLRSSFSLLLVLTALVAMRPNTGNAQAVPTNHTAVVSVNPLGAIIDRPIWIQYESKLDPAHSWAARLLYFSLSSTAQAWGIGGSYRFYDIFNSRALTGFSVSPAAEILFLSNKAGQTATSLLVGGDVAYKWILTDFAIEPLIGIRIGFSGDGVSGGSSGASAMIGLNLGFGL